MKRIAILFALVAMLQAPLFAASATTAVSMRIPSMVILYHRGSVDFDIPETTLATLLAGGSVVDEGIASLVDFGGDAAVTATPFTSPGSLRASVRTFWAVRSIAGLAEETRVTVSIPAGSDSLSNGTDSITISDPVTDVSGGSPSLSSVTFTPTGLGSYQAGDVEFDLDLSSVTTTGTYTGGAILITAENL